MTNLLPPNAKKQIVLEYWTRVVCAWIILWAACLFVGLLLLWPTYVLLSGSSDAYAESADAATERTNEYAEMTAILERASNQAKEIVITSERPRMSHIIEAVFSAANFEGVQISSIRISRESNEIQPLAISGSAKNRLALAQLRDALESLTFVEVVELPIENLAKNEDIDFSLTIVVINEEL